MTLIETGGDVLVNGTEVDKKIELAHGDRIIFGNNHMYVLYHPQDASKKIKAGQIKGVTRNASDIGQFSASHRGEIRRTWDDFLLPIGAKSVGHRTIFCFT